MTSPDIHGPGLSSSTGARIVIIERPGCHLCDEASTIVHKVAAEFGAEVEHKDIDADAALAKRWSLEIPVVAVDGKVVAVYRVQASELRAALAPKKKGILSRIFSGK